MSDVCPRLSDTCPLCGLFPGDDCPLDEVPFEGPAIGATNVVGKFDGGETCESCQ